MVKNVVNGIHSTAYRRWSSLSNPADRKGKTSPDTLYGIGVRRAGSRSEPIERAALSFSGDGRRAKQLIPVYSERGRLLSYVIQGPQMPSDTRRVHSRLQEGQSDSVEGRHAGQIEELQLPEMSIDPCDWAGAVFEVGPSSEVSPLLPTHLRRSDAPESSSSEAAQKAPHKSLEWEESDRDKRDKVASRWATGVVVKFFAGFGMLAGALAGFLLGGPPGVISGASAGFLLVGGLAATIAYIAGYRYATAAINDEKKALVAAMKQTLPSVAATRAAADSADVTLEFTSQATSAVSRKKGARKPLRARRSAESDEANGKSSVRARHRRKTKSKTSEPGRNELPFLPRRQSTFVYPKSFGLAEL